MHKVFLKQLSSLEKVFLDEKPLAKDYTKASVLKGEEFSYQIAYSCYDEERVPLKVELKSPIDNYITIKNVVHIPSALPTYGMTVDDDYITTKSGLFPDALFPMGNDEILGCLACCNKYSSLWISVCLDENIDSGIYPIDISFCADDFLQTLHFELEVIDAVLPKQELIYTQWFHSDCIANYYGVKVFSKKFWQLVEKFIKMAIDNGINMILTPIFTPPLDTEVGRERLTVQLIDVYLKNNVYSFDFTNLKKWIRLCKKCGVEYFEMAHLFTQWGAKATPKIIADVDGVKKQIFGWDVSSDSESYKDFLKAMLPALSDFLKNEKIDKNTYFHISDEPNEKCLDVYKAGKELVSEYLSGYKVIDAVSHIEYYDEGIVDYPIPSVNAINLFLEKEIKEIWTYYCCCQNQKVSNRFFAMPSYRNRIIGIQLYKYDIKGFLHWGYNFYNAFWSKFSVNPYFVSDACMMYPSGDCYSVYPGTDGPIESIRLKVFKEALQDIRALKLLESYIGKENTVKFIQYGLDFEIEFDNYPKSAEYILQLRERVNYEIKRICKDSIYDKK